MIRSRTWILGIALGAIAVGVAALAADTPILAVYTGVFWAIGTVMTAHNAEAVPGLLRGGSAHDTTAQLWSGAFGGLTALAVSGIVGSRLTDAADVWFVLGLFVIGVAVVMTNVGVGLARSMALE